MKNTTTNRNTISRFTRFCAFALAHIVTPTACEAVVGCLPAPSHSRTS